MPHGQERIAGHGQRVRREIHSLHLPPQSCAGSTLPRDTQQMQWWRSLPRQAQGPLAVLGRHVGARGICLCLLHHTPRCSGAGHISSPVPAFVPWTAPSGASTCLPPASDPALRYERTPWPSSLTRGRAGGHSATRHPYGGHAGSRLEWGPRRCVPWGLREHCHAMRFGPSPFVVVWLHWASARSPARASIRQIWMICIQLALGVATPALLDPTRPVAPDVYSQPMQRPSIPMQAH